MPVQPNLYATLDDINVHLPVEQGKAQMMDGQDDMLQVDAYRLIRGRLSGTFDLTVINTWTNPATTPEQIRQIAGKLIAAKWYALLVAEDEPDGSLYAQTLYNEAIAALNDIRNGTMSVIGIDGLEIESTTATQTAFYPNDTAPDPSFSVEETWA
jgi:hypothetical protein